MSGAIRAGWGSADITPRGGPVSLYGQWETRVTDVINDPLLANAMVICSDDARTIWAACDLCYTSKSLSDEVKRLMRASLPGFRDEQLILSATHVHTGPDTDTEPFTTLMDGRDEPPGTIPTFECLRRAALGIESAVLRAAASAEPSRFEFSISHTITGVNRRVSYKNGGGAMYGDMRGPDFAGMEGRDGGPMQLIFTRRVSDNKLTGVVAAVPCTAQADESASYVTADYWAAAREIINKELGDVVVLGLIRSAGDLSPHTMADGGKLVGELRGRDGAVEIGTRIGEAIVRASGGIIASYGSDAVYKHARASGTLPLWGVTESEYKAAEAYLEAAKDDPELIGDRMAYSQAAARVKRRGLGITEYPANFYAVRIGDIVLLTNPFECYIEYAERIRAACPEAQLIDIQLAGDDFLGYLPTKKAVGAGGYSATIFSCRCGPDGGDEMVEKSIALVRSLFGEWE